MSPSGIGWNQRTLHSVLVEKHASSQYLSSNETYAYIKSWKDDTFFHQNSKNTVTN